MRVQVVDPPAYTPPYDRSLCAALARAGADVELVTSPFLHGRVPAAQGYEVREHFYVSSAKRGLSARARRPRKAAEHLTRLSEEAPLPPELAGVEGPVVLFFGLVRP